MEEQSKTSAERKHAISIVSSFVFSFDGSFIIAGENIRGYDMSEIGPHSPPEGKKRKGVFEI